MKKIKKLIPWILFVALVVGLGAWVVRSQEKPVDGKYDAFAQCLTDKGFAMYGTYWCPHCKAEKAKFGTSFKKVSYVECTQDIKQCQDQKIESYPTWIKSSGSTTERFVGEQGLEKLSEVSGCLLPTE